jgi:hypothetical protein
VFLMSNKYKYSARREEALRKSMEFSNRLNKKMHQHLDHILGHPYDQKRVAHKKRKISRGRSARASYSTPSYSSHKSSFPSWDW